MARLGRVALTSALMVFVGCTDGVEGVDSGADGGMTTGDAGSCAHACDTLGATRCMGTTIQGCSLDMMGCRQWEDGLDCAESSRTCDDGAEPATCVDSTGTCDDGTQNQDETDVDCGGSRCDACANGGGCERASDCESNNCDTTTDMCVPPETATCTDGTQNGAETDVDCGGDTCDPCAVGEMCSAGSDCASGMCDTTCQPIPGTCDDGMLNQDESDVDCGGDTCGACGIGLDCGDAMDCSSGYCDGGGACATPPASCMDGLQNGDETDVDCGGSCDACEDGEGCDDVADCTGGYCVANRCQSAGTCDDGVRNQDETGTDCGGATCAACPNGRGCVDDGDCRSGVCDTTGVGVCANPGGPTCADGMQNRDETDVDCGGSFCMPCALGEVCVDNLDCAGAAVCDLIDTRTCVTTDPSYLVDEDFETGDFSRFPYGFESAGAAEAHDWVIETDAASCHAGSYCMRTSRSHAGGEVTRVTLALSVREDTQISFWIKTELEPDEHYFRFYVDGVLAVERTGQNDWELVTASVLATEPNGPDRVFTWEYDRSTFVSPDHTPWYEVWIDDIDMPAWNTEPSVPEQIAPTNGQTTTDSTPTFRWRSFDPDFDPITYELEYDTDPSFPLPVSTGETNDTTFTPPADLADGIYYWRVRSKDDSNFRWSEWSPVYALEVDTGYEYAAVWRQSVDAQFQMNTLEGGTVIDDSVIVNSYDRTISGTYSAPSGSRDYVFDDISPGSILAGTTASISITARGDFNSSTEYATVSGDGTSLGRFNGSSTSSCSTAATNTLSDSGIFARGNDGSYTVRFTTNSAVGSCASNNIISVRLRWGSGLEGVMTSVPIRFSTFEGKTLWEKVQVAGTGQIVIQVLDEAGALIPDAIIPGNSTGTSERTLRLWDLDPMVYPVIRLRATISAGARLDEWRVVGNDHHEWTFENPGDLEGWVPMDRLGTPAASVADGYLHYTSTSDGTDPRIEYTMPQPIDSARFTEAEIRVRTSTEFFNDDLMFFWSSNFGSFDVRRSFTSAGVFLVNFQDVTIDLTQTPMAPNETWRGMIEGLRIDPTDHFVDEFGMPADGHFDIDRVILR